MELYKEIGKYFFNLSLIIIGSLLLQKIAEGIVSFWVMFWGFALSLLSFGMGVIFYKKGLRK